MTPLNLVLVWFLVVIALALGSIRIARWLANRPPKGSPPKPGQARAQRIVCEYWGIPWGERPAVLWKKPRSMGTVEGRTLSARLIECEWWGEFSDTAFAHEHGHVKQLRDGRPGLHTEGFLEGVEDCNELLRKAGY